MEWGIPPFIFSINICSTRNEVFGNFNVCIVYSPVSKGLWGSFFFRFGMIVSSIWLCFFLSQGNGGGSGEKRLPLHIRLRPLESRLFRFRQRPRFVCWSGYCFRYEGLHQWGIGCVVRTFRYRLRFCLCLNLLRQPLKYVFVLDNDRHHVR